MPTSPPLAPASQPPPPSPTPPPAPPSPWLDAPLAPASWRLGGLVLDAILVGCTLVVGWLAWWIIDWDSGRSPAKSILHTRVVRAATRELPGFGRMALREAVGKAVPAGAGLLGLLTLGDGSSAARFLVAASVAWYAMSVVAALLDPQRRALWDMIAGTIVVLDPDVSPTDVTPTAEADTAPM
ncbi:MAG TPA: RDD family protein [Acidimicrobiales bacterium]|nr:RDD family protein [Acidimicrobiales bacterium]